MKRKWMFAVAVAGLVLGALPALAGDPSGTWIASFATPVGDRHYVYTFAVAGQKLTGTVQSDAGQTQIQDGTVTGDELYFVEVLTLQGAPLRIEYRGALAGDEIRFRRRIEGQGEDQIIAKRAK